MQSKNVNVPIYSHQIYQIVQIMTHVPRISSLEEYTTLDFELKQCYQPNTPLFGLYLVHQLNPIVFSSYLHKIDTFEPTFRYQMLEKVSINI